MNGRTLGKPLTDLLSQPLFRLHFRPFTANSNLDLPKTPSHITPVDPSHLLRICTVLYQQQNASDSKLYAHLSRCQFDLTHEFFLQVCNKFPSSWRPVYRFFQFAEAQTQTHFTHTSISFNKMLDVVGKSRNIDLFWQVLHETGRRGLVTDKTYRIALQTLASVRELKKCVEFFHVMNRYGRNYSLETLNKVIDTLCKSKLVVEAKDIVTKLRDWIKPNGETYKYLIFGFCDAGDLVEASKIWNLMVDEGFEPQIGAVEKMMETFARKASSMKH